MTIGHIGPVIGLLGRQGGSVRADVELLGLDAHGPLGPKPVLAVCPGVSSVRMAKSIQAQSRGEASRPVGPERKSGSRILAAYHLLSGEALAGSGHSFRRYGAASAI